MIMRLRLSRRLPTEAAAVAAAVATMIATEAAWALAAMEPMVAAEVAAVRLWRLWQAMVSQSQAGRHDRWRVAGAAMVRRHW